MKRLERPTEAPARLPGRLYQGWERFWFKPADPTLLGLMRLCAGVLVLYIHVAYTFDLQNLFGEGAWLDLATLDAFRHDVPIVPPPSGWQLYQPAEPANAEQQEYVERYKARWGAPPPAPFPRAAEEAKEIDDYQVKWGVDPRVTLTRGRPLWSVWFHVTDPAGMRVVHAAILVVMFLFTIGFCTRVTSVLTWLGVLAYIQRAPTTLFGMDTIMIVIVLYLMIGPSGAALSVDRLIARYWATRRALRRHEPVPDPAWHEPSVSANLALRLLQVHLCFIYLGSGLSKLQGQTWWGGTAVWMTMANYEFSPLTLRPYAEALRWLAGHRWLWEAVMTSSTIGTLVFEISFAFLVWHRPLRWVMLVGAVLLHTGIAFFMGLTMFSLMMLTLVLAFVPPAAVQRLLAWLGEGATPLRLFFNGRERRQVRLASAVHAVDVWNQVELVELPSPPAGRARGRAGVQRFGRRARDGAADGTERRRPPAPTRHGGGRSVYRSGAVRAPGPVAASAHAARAPDVGPRRGPTGGGAVGRRGPVARAASGGRTGAGIPGRLGRFPLRVVWVEGTLTLLRGL